MKTEEITRTTKEEKEIREFQRCYRVAKKRLPVGAILTALLAAFVIWTWDESSPRRNWLVLVPVSIFALILLGDIITVFHSRTKLRKLGGEIPLR